jgi:hypothetical protein
MTSKSNSGHPGQIKGMEAHGPANTRPSGMSGSTTSTGGGSGEIGRAHV